MAQTIQKKNPTSEERMQLRTLQEIIENSRFYDADFREAANEANDRGIEHLSNLSGRPLAQLAVAMAAGLLEAAESLIRMGEEED